MSGIDMGDSGRPYRLRERFASTSDQRLRYAARWGFRRCWWAVCGALLIAVPSGARAAQDLDALEVTRRIAASGALDLALERVEQSQPREPSASAWADWELLRIDLLLGRGRDVEALKRVEAIRNVALPDRIAVTLWLNAARAAWRSGRGRDARVFLARAFARADPASGDYRRLRLMVIETYLTDRNPEDVYRSVLRFQQDFAPLTREEAERFVSGLIGLDRTAEAAQWLGQLDAGSPWASLLRLRAGLLGADAALKQARLSLARGAEGGAWELLLAAGQALKNRAIELEVHETRLNLLRAADGAAIAAQSAALWTSYQQAGQLAANQSQLLTGDDTSWLQHAGRIAQSEPQVARALFANLALGARAADVREFAHLQLVSLLRDAKLPQTALRLYADAHRFPAATLGARLRLLLGSVAAENRLGAEAVRYWQNLPTPEGLSPSEWQVRYLAVLFQAGMVDAGMSVAKSLLGSNRSLTDDQLKRLIAVASDAIEVWHVRAAESLFNMLAPRVSGSDRVPVLFGLARARELTGDFRQAADAYLQVAALAAHAESDREALRARELGALNLAKAGMLDDARATYRWLATHAKEAAVRDNAVRALKNL